MSIPLFPDACSPITPFRMNTYAKPHRAMAGYGCYPSYAFGRVRLARKRNLPQIASDPSMNQSPLRRSSLLTVVVPLLLAIATAPSSFAQAASPAPQMDELQTRIKAAATARESADAKSVADANAKVLALAHRRLANIRVAQTAFLQ